MYASLVMCRRMFVWSLGSSIQLFSEKWAKNKKKRSRIGKQAKFHACSPRRAAGCFQLWMFPRAQLQEMSPSEESRYTWIFKIWGQNTWIEKDGKCSLQLKSVKRVRVLFVKSSRRCLFFGFWFCFAQNSTFWNAFGFYPPYCDSPGVTVTSLSKFLFSLPLSLFSQVSVLLLRVATHSTPSKALKSYTSRRQAGKHDYFQPAFISPELIAGSICRRGQQYFQWINWEGSRCFVRVRNSAGMLCNAFSMSFLNVPGAKHSLKALIPNSHRQISPCPRTHFYLQ